MNSEEFKHSFLSLGYFDAPVTIYDCKVLDKSLLTLNKTMTTLAS